MKFVRHLIAWTPDTKYNLNLSSIFEDERWRDRQWCTLPKKTPLLASARNPSRPGNASQGGAATTYYYMEIGNKCDTWAHVIDKPLITDLAVSELSLLGYRLLRSCRARARGTACFLSRWEGDSLANGRNKKFNTFLFRNFQRRISGRLPYNLIIENFTKNCGPI